MLLLIQAAQHRHAIAGQVQSNLLRMPRYFTTVMFGRIIYFSLCSTGVFLSLGSSSSQPIRMDVFLRILAKVNTFSIAHLVAHCTLFVTNKDRDESLNKEKLESDE